MDDDEIISSDPVIGDGTMDGWITNYNFPGDDNGETNGFYAGVTRNNNNAAGGGTDYWGSTGSDLLGGVRDAIKGVGDVAKEVSKQVPSVRTAVGGARTAATQPQNSLVGQWNALSTLNKVAFICTIFGVVYVLRRGVA